MTYFSRGVKPQTESRTMTEMRILGELTRDDLREIAAEARAKTADIQPVEIAALKVDDLGFMQALEEALREADELRTELAQQVVDVLNSVYDNDPPQPYDCAECGRSYGPNYTGACEH